ncbi:hypothetical protein ACFVYC_14870 [Pseudarthrobacter sp. NPDC058329]|uniref:hypothetical protein n=1 Tax=Pseudarthrobacter sp. NPDC058329 TaxID=3346448 RepID=UPI0036DFA2A7
MNTQKTHVEIHVQEPGRLGQLLAEAEEALIVEANSNCEGGILVTRHTPNRYTLTLSAAVPYGETRELSML